MLNKEERTEASLNSSLRSSQSAGQSGSGHSRVCCSGEVSQGVFFLRIHVIFLLPETHY